MDSHAYVQGSSYEVFISRAHKKERHQVPGADGSYMKNLINTENGEDLRRLVGSYEKQLEQIKKYMDKALDKYLKMKLTAEERAIMEQLKIRLVHAGDSRSLMAIVDAGIDASQRFKE